MPLILLLLTTTLAQTMTRDGADTWVRTETGSFAVVVSRPLTIRTRGHVIVHGDNTDRIAYVLTQRVRARNEETAHRRFSGTITDSLVAEGTLRILAAPDALVTTQISITVPRRLAGLTIDAQPGDVEVYDLDSNVRATTAAGQIHCDRIRGRCEARTGGGEIRLGKIGGAIQCVNAAGPIVVDSAGGGGNCTSAGGEIQIRDAAGPLTLSTEAGNIEVDRAGSNVEAHTAQGVIDIAQSNGMVVADTRGGSIQIGSARGVRCQSGSGPVRVKCAAGPMQIQTALGSIMVELLANARIQESSLTAGSGDITVLIPSNVALSVLARNDSGTNPKIVSDFSEVRARSIAPQPPAVVYRTTVYQGSINGGGPLMMLNTAAGIIYVRKK
ncbi:MAG TPA: DUF4097 family beta strand repeat-containing protein [Bryobacteraceae bacterium]|nr:DUF4097 family beta strand repeat-containing protein [Bryobacteraceae bacterium]